MRYRPPVKNVERKNNDEEFKAEVNKLDKNKRGFYRAVDYLFRKEKAKRDGYEPVFLIKCHFLRSRGKVFKTRKLGLKQSVGNEEYDTIRRQVDSLADKYDTAEKLAALKSKSKFHTLYAWCIEYDNFLAQEVCYF